MRILVTGGAGYIGSHIVKELIAQGHKVFVFDNLSNGHKQAISNINFPRKSALSPRCSAILIKGDLSDRNKLNQVFRKYKPEAVIHMAADSLVGESMDQPEKYLKNNILNGLTLLEAMIKNKIKYLIFSSSAAVYGEPKKMPIKETDIINPKNIYGQTKYIFEEILKYFDKKYNLKFISLRYFNAAGADLSGLIGEDRKSETHLIPNILKVALGQKKYLEIFGNDYKTKDGTCIRDYIHVNDLATAHILALKFLVKKKQSRIYNLGSESGFSVKEILNVCRKVIYKKPVTTEPQNDSETQKLRSEIQSLQENIPVRIMPRRPGDPPKLIASSAKIKKELGWQPKYSDLETIITSAWKFHKRFPKGYNQ